MANIHLGKQPEYMLCWSTNQKNVGLINSQIHVFQKEKLGLINLVVFFLPPIHSCADHFQKGESSH